MINPEQIPDDVAFALLDIYALWLGDTDQARAAIASALNAWPDMQLSCLTVEVPGRKIILPLPQEKQNAK